MNVLRVVFCGAVAVCFAGQVGLAQETRFRAELVAPTDGVTKSETEGLNTATVLLAEGSAGFEATVDIFIDAALEPCVSDPMACDKTENFLILQEGNPVPIGFGCSDMTDNDEDGLTDAEDPDCRGIQGWSLSVETDACFGISGATTTGTIAALTIAGGIRGFSSFEKTEVVNPARNEGRFGAVTAVVLSLTNPVIADQVGESKVLVLTGAMDSSTLGPGGLSDPCPLEFIDPGVEGLRGAGEPVKTAITVAGETKIPAITNLQVIAQIEGGAPPEDCSTEGDEDGNGLADCEDPACVELPECGDPPPPGGAQASLRVEITAPAAVAGEKADGTVPYTIDSAAATDVSATIIITSAIATCVEDPSACDMTENFQVLEGGIPIGFGCADMIDNDEDGLTDNEDPDCVGIQGWSYSVVTDECFNISAATTMGTAGALIIQGGLRDLQSFEKSEVVNPGRNDGLMGAVSALVLSLTNPVILPQVSENPILIISGNLDPASPGPCNVRITGTDEDGLRGSGEPVKTAVTFAGTTINPDVCGASVQLGEGGGPETDCGNGLDDDGDGAIDCDDSDCVGTPDCVAANFIRGNANDDSKVNIADPVWIISELFREGPASVCKDAADANDDGQVDQTDALFLIMHQFEMGPAPSAPFGDCGTDPTADDLDCQGDAVTSCSQPS